MRLGILSVIGLVSAAVCSAGSVQLGGPAGLTSNYITQGAGAVCAAGPNQCVTGSVGGFTEKNYDVRLYASSTNSGMPSPYTGYTQTTAPASGNTLGQFAMISDGTSGGNSNNFWDAGSATTMTIPVGILGVADVWTMLNNIWGPAGASDTVVTFNFGTASNSGVDNILQVNLVNTGVGGTTGGQIRSGFDCTSPLTTCGSSALNSNTALANGTLASTSTATSILNSVAGPGVTVTTQNMFHASGYTIGAGTFAGSTGNLNLDAQNFNLSAFSSEYLVSIQVQELSGVGAVSQTSLSAITVDTAPEPSTVFLFLTGFGALGLARMRRPRSLRT